MSSSPKSKPIRVPGHIELAWYKRAGVDASTSLDDIRVVFEESIPVGISNPHRKGRYHPPTEAVFIFAEKKNHIDLITVYRYGPQTADIIKMDHLVQCASCELTVDPTYGECRWCGDDLSRARGVQAIPDHPANRESWQDRSPRFAIGQD